MYINSASSLLTNDTLNNLEIIIPILFNFSLSKRRNHSADCLSSLTALIAPLADSALTASSEHDGNHGPHRSRLNTQGSYGAWSTLTNIADEWIQADFGSEKTIQRVATQGRYDHDQWVTSYKFAHSSDGSTWTFLLDGSGNEEVFSGNSDRETIVEHNFTPTLARYVRVYPMEWIGHISLRWDVYGCEASSAATDWGRLQIAFSVLFL